MMSDIGGLVRHKNLAVSHVRWTSDQEFGVFIVVRINKEQLEAINVLAGWLAGNEFNLYQDQLNFVKILANI